MRVRWLFGAASAGAFLLFACSSFTSDDGSSSPSSNDDAGVSPSNPPNPEAGGVGDADSPNTLARVPFDKSLEDDCATWNTHHQTSATVVDDGDGGLACEVCAIGADTPHFISKEVDAGKNHHFDVSFRARSTLARHVAAGFQVGDINKPDYAFTAGVDVKPEFAQTSNSGPYADAVSSARVTLEIDGNDSSGCVQFDSVVFTPTN